MRYNGWVHLRISAMGAVLLFSLLSATNVATGVKAEEEIRFEVAAIRPSAPTGGHLGYTGYPGRIDMGNQTLAQMIALAYDCQLSQIERGPDWARSMRFDVQATFTPMGSREPAHTAPTSLERRMIQQMLMDRFHLFVSTKVKPTRVLVLVKIGNNDELHTTEHSDLIPGASFMISSEGIATGDAMGRNVTMEDLAKSLSKELSQPVANHTGIQGSYDFRVHVPEPNTGDELEGVSTGLRVLGLGIRGGTAPVAHLTIESAEKPTEN